MLISYDTSLTDREMRSVNPCDQGLLDFLFAFKVALIVSELCAK